MDAVPITRPSRLWKNKADFFRPFRAAANEAAEELVYDPEQAKLDEPETELRELNEALHTLRDVFPDVQPEVFREMLVSVSAESRLEIVTEQLLLKKAKCVKGRFRSRSNTRPMDGNSHLQGELFRPENYKKAAKQVCYQEFKSLSHSSIKAVLAEHNFSYSLSRPILHQVSTTSWRATISNLWSPPKRQAPTPATNHPFIVWRTDATIAGNVVPAVKRTGDGDLDRELYDLFVAPTLRKLREEQVLADFVAANHLNEAEAQAANALFDCECCYGTSAFEKVITCDNDAHVHCLDCVKRAVREALFGQGWARTTDLHKGTIRCFALTAQACSGSIPSSFTRRALLSGNDSGGEAEHMWEVFQNRITSETIIQSGLHVQRCPSCEYAEVDELPEPHLKSPLAVWHHFTKKSTLAAQLMSISCLVAVALTFTLPMLTIVLVFLLLLKATPQPIAPLRNSWSRIHRGRCSPKFRCQSPACGQVSCMTCKTTWRDPHICYESEKTSLRTAIEASATSAIKRTCPRCMLGFVKESGCNKMVCHCGYTMCYICRQEILSREGYAHFCQHFRPHGGRCTECDKCDLYGDEDEEASIRQAVTAAERAWREKEQGNNRSTERADGKAKNLMIEAIVEQAHGRPWLEQWLDAVMDALFA